MKITVKIEAGAPLIFFPDAPANPGRVLCWSAIDGHSEAQRAYMRNLPSPVTELETRAAWRALHHYSALPPNS